MKTGFVIRKRDVKQYMIMIRTVYTFLWMLPHIVVKESLPWLCLLLFKRHIAWSETTLCRLFQWWVSKSLFYILITMVYKYRICLCLDKCKRDLFRKVNSNDIKILKSRLKMVNLRCSGYRRIARLPTYFMVHT